MRKNPKNAFTMAEAILVMTILGIIATIMITTLKPADYKDKGMAILAKKVLSEIDTATTMILMNNSLDGTFKYLYYPQSSNTFQFRDDCSNVGRLYKKYLTATRKTWTVNATGSGYGWTHTNGHTSFYHNGFMLKDGAFIGLYCSGQGTEGASTIFPGETSIISRSLPQGRILYDINGEEEPNVAGKDVFLIPIDNNGILYAND